MESLLRLVETYIGSAKFSLLRATTEENSSFHYACQVHPSRRLPSILCWDGGISRNRWAVARQKRWRPTHGAVHARFQIHDEPTVWSCSAIRSRTVG